ncbi:MAG: hypothetical protein IPM36_22975 [Lewinellaceae bacterium]|nr:hypothetical protein [Lewinellaceae bacterium]
MKYALFTSMKAFCAFALAVDSGDKKIHYFKLARQQPGRSDCNCPGGAEPAFRAVIKIEAVA